jgi:hypothetical protein
MIHVGLDLHHRTSYVRAMDDHGEVFPGWRSASYPHTPRRGKGGPGHRVREGQVESSWGAAHSSRPDALRSSARNSGSTFPPRRWHSFTSAQALSWSPLA